MKSLIDLLQEGGSSKPSENETAPPPAPERKLETDEKV